jgi:hypothetical protein
VKREKRGEGGRGREGSKDEAEDKDGDARWIR